MREDGYETIMVNCNPETVSTDYDTSDRLYFEPVTLEDVLEIVAKENPKGVIVQFGGQTPLKLARDLEAAGVPIIGTTPDAIDRAEDRERFQQMIVRLGLKQPANATVRSTEEAMKVAEQIGYPWLCAHRMCLVAARWKSFSSRKNCKNICVLRCRYRKIHRYCSTAFCVQPWKSISMRLATAKPL
jgi:carbamoylphosphate synthase large subunit